MCHLPAHWSLHVPHTCLLKFTCDTCPLTEINMCQCPIAEVFMWHLLTHEIYMCHLPVLWSLHVPISAQWSLHVPLARLLKFTFAACRLTEVYMCHLLILWSLHVPISAQWILHVAMSTHRSLHVPMSATWRLHVPLARSLKFICATYMLTYMCHLPAHWNIHVPPTRSLKFTCTNARSLKLTRATYPLTEIHIWHLVHGYEWPVGNVYVSNLWYGWRGRHTVKCGDDCIAVSVPSTTDIINWVSIE